MFLHGKSVFAIKQPINTTFIPDSVYSYNIHEKSIAKRRRAMSLPDEVIHHIVDNVCGRILISCDRGVSVLVSRRYMARSPYVGAMSSVIGYESVPKIPTNDTMNALFRTAISVLLVSNRNSFRVPCSIESLPYILYRKMYLYDIGGNGQRMV